MKIHDISLTLSAELPVWPGDPRIRLERMNKIDEGAHSNVSEIQMRVHSGTHVDAPVHFLNDSLLGADSLSLTDLVGFCIVAEIPDEVDVITRTVLEQIYLPDSCPRILFKTRNSTYWQQELGDFQEKFVGIDASAAEYLMDRGVRLVGLDYLSIAPYQNSRPTHEIFLKNRVVILEGVNLSGVTAGYYTLICLPLKLAGSDGAPARAILIEEE